MTQSTVSNSYRWLQLTAGIVCMVMIANLQYGWTLFVTPIDDKYHWGRAGIQIAFSIFVLTETWLVPVEGWFVDRFGPKIVVLVGGILVGIAWVMNAMRNRSTVLYIAAAIGGIGAGARLRHLRRQCAQMVSGPPRPGGWPDRRRVRRWFGADHHPDPEHDPVERL